MNTDPQEKESKANLDRLDQRSDRILSWFYRSRFIVAFRLDFKFSFIYSSSSVLSSQGSEGEAGMPGLKGSKVSPVFFKRISRSLISSSASRLNSFYVCFCPHIRENLESREI